MIWLWECLIAQIKRQGALIATQKWPHCFALKGFLDFVNNSILQNVEVFFALQSLRPGASYDLSNTPIQWFYFFCLYIYFFLTNFADSCYGGQNVSFEEEEKNIFFFVLVYKTTPKTPGDPAYPKWQEKCKNKFSPPLPLYTINCSYFPLATYSSLLSFIKYQAKKETTRSSIELIQFILYIICNISLNTKIFMRDIKTVYYIIYILKYSCTVWIVILGNPQVDALASKLESNIVK